MSVPYSSGCTWTQVWPETAAVAVVAAAAARLSSPVPAFRHAGNTKGTRQGIGTLLSLLLSLAEPRSLQSLTGAGRRLRASSTLRGSRRQQQGWSGDGGRKQGGGAAENTGGWDRGTSYPLR